MNWRRTSTGGWISEDGVWKVRGPIFGFSMYWLYYNPLAPKGKGAGQRYLREEGNYDSAVSFRSAGAAKKFAEKEALKIKNALQSK